MPSVLDQPVPKEESRGSAAKPSLDLSIISVNWNSVDYLRECIASVF